MTERLDEVSDTYSETVDVPSTWTRRRMIAMGSVGVVGAAGLAACGGGSDGDGDSDGDSSGGATGGSSSDSTATAASGTKLAKLSDVPVGSAIVLDAGGEKILLAQPTEGKAVAFSAICTHQGCTVAASGKCPCHGSDFDLATGAVKNGPATKALPAVAVSVNDAGEVVLGS